MDVFIAASADNTSARRRAKTVQFVSPCVQDQSHWFCDEQQLQTSTCVGSPFKKSVTLVNERRAADDDHRFRTHISVS